MTEKKSIVIGADHLGLELKNTLVEHLKSKGYEVKDMGVADHNPVDYPDIGIKVAEAVGRGDYPRGILVCGTGAGMAITANKVPGVRAAVCGDTFTARMSREHNDVNVLCLGARLTGRDLGREILEIWLDSTFAGDRHARRVGKITALEQRLRADGCR